MIVIRRALAVLRVATIPMNSTILEDKIRKIIVNALNDYDLIAADDRIMVAVSGGKDSTILLLLLDAIRKKSQIPFTLQAVILDQKQPGFSVDSYREFLLKKGLELIVIEEDTYSIVKEKVPENKTTCGLCSRLRRGILYNYAHANGYNKIALGHHRDDFNETLLLNLFYSGSIASMPAKLFSDDGRNIVIRPLCYVAEADIAELAKIWQVPVIPCNLCGSQENLKRKEIKGLIANLEKSIPQLPNSLLKAQGNIKTSQLLDRNLHDEKRRKSRFLMVVECLLEWQNKFLLIRRPFGGHAALRLGVPGGKVESQDGADNQNILLTAVKREVFEEVGIELKSEPNLCHTSFFADDKNGEPIIACLYHLKLDEEPSVKADPREVPEYFWLTKDEVFAHPDVPGWLKRLVSSVH